MFKRTAFSILTGVILSALATVQNASAATVNVSYNFQSYSSLPSGNHFLEGAPNLDLLVTAAGGALTIGTTNGLGVGANSLVDNAESLTFQFTPPVNVTSVGFTLINANNNTNASNGDNPVISYSLDGSTWLSATDLHPVSGDIVSGAYSYSVTFPGPFSYFRVAAKDGNDSFGVGSINVNYDLSGDPNIVVGTPLPSAAWMGLSSLAALGVSAARRGRSRKI